MNFHLLVVPQSCNLQTSMSELDVGILTAPCKIRLDQEILGRPVSYIISTFIARLVYSYIEMSHSSSYNVCQLNKSTLSIYVSK